MPPEWGMRTLTTRIFPAQAAESGRQSTTRETAYCKIWVYIYVC
jgi:hypothetical protein